MEIFGDKLAEFAHVGTVTKSWELMTPDGQEFKVSIVRYEAHGGTIQHYSPDVQIYEDLASGSRWVNHTVSSSAHDEEAAFRDAMAYIRDWLGKQV